MVDDVLEVIRAASIKAPVAVGDTVLTDVAGTGANVIATRRVTEKKK